MGSIDIFQRPSRSVSQSERTTPLALKRPESLHKMAHVVRPEGSAPLRTGQPTVCPALASRSASRSVGDHGLSMCRRPLTAVPLPAAHSLLPGSFHAFAMSREVLGDAVVGARSL